MVMMHPLKTGGPGMPGYQFKGVIVGYNSSKKAHLKSKRAKLKRSRAAKKTALLAKKK